MTERTPDPSAALRRLDPARIPDFPPAWLTFLVSDAGELWFARFPTPEDGGGTTFDVFEPDGRYLGALEAPVRLYPRPTVLGDRLVGVVQDASGVQQVVVFRIERGHTT